MNDFYKFTVDLTKKAGEFLKELYHLDFVVSHKGDDIRDVVTDADIKISHFISSAIKKQFPDHAIYSEEGTDIFVKKTKYVWSIDPIDGTSNFSRHIPHFAICVGLMENGVPVIGAVYNPITDELFSFQKGGGAFLNGQKIRISLETDLKKSFVLLHVGRDPKIRDWGIGLYKKLLGEVKKINNFASSSLDICFVAAGRAELAVYGTLTTMDISSAIGILEEAGGQIMVSDLSEKFSKKPQKVFAVCNNAIKERVAKYF
ncbi:MAG: inositol monophosphatase [Candidatus Niyogibacteria bacterium]|nr:inositol monophosphatase [Candidatus Niyogibacteria bacterium]